MLDKTSYCIYNTILKMKYEWDENKRAANLAKHGVDFIDAEHFDWSLAIEAIDDRFNYGEDRWVALGSIGNRLHVLAYAVRGENIRLISLRKANKRERGYYEEKT
jgi:uncharacterized DUF497 family protein